MKRLKIHGAALLALALALMLSAAAPSARAAPLADSQGEFSSTQGQDGWSYGFFDATAHGPYTSAGFEAFALYNAGAQRWEASDAQVGAANNDFLSINAEGGHPNGVGPDAQDASIWAVRRWTSEVSGLVRIDFDLHKVNVSNPNGGGITGHVFVDGSEIYAQFIDNADGAGVVSSLLVNLALGSVVDFAIDPLGLATPGRNDGPLSARADGTHFSARLSLANLAEPTALALLGSGLLLLVALGLRARTGRQAGARGA